MIEVRDVKQDNPSRRARWFVDDECELHVWVEESTGRILHFQFCWNRHRDEHVLEWRANPSAAFGGALHARIDDGESSPSDPAAYPRSPIIVKNGVLDLDRVITTFEKHAAEIDPAIRRFVRNTLIGEREKS